MHYCRCFGKPGIRTVVVGYYQLKIQLLCKFCGLDGGDSAIDGDYKLGTGIPYGVRWSNLGFLTEFPRRLEALLHRFDIWTWEDFENHPNEARLAFLRAGLQEMKKEARHE